MGTGDLMKILEFDLEYYEMIQSLIEKLKAANETTINDLIGEIAKTYNYDKIKMEEIISYLIHEKYIEIQQQKRNFGNCIIKLKKTPKIMMRESNLISKEPILTLTLPPFNIFGLTDELTKKSIKYVSLEEGFYDLFKVAEEKIFICSPFIDYDGYFIFEDIIKSKLQSGILLKILTRVGKKTNSSRFREINKIYENIKSFKNQVSIYDYFYEKNNKLKSSIHSKIIIIDDKKVYLGSGEIRENSFRKNFELGLVLEGEIALNISRIFEKICSVSKILYRNDHHETVV